MKVPETPPDPEANWRELIQDGAALDGVIKAGLASPTVGDRYLHWDKLRFLTPAEGITHERWWAAIKFARGLMGRRLPLRGVNGAPFLIAMPDPLMRLLSECDRDLSGRVSMPEQVRNPATRHRYLVSALIEEAITSSQLEGATSTRQVAAEMLRSGRKPRDHHERMIFHNFQAMKLIRGIADRPLSPELVLEIHREIARETLDDPEDAGRLRRRDDVVVATSDDVTVLHRPPPARELAGRLREMCDFANGKTPDFYVHAIVRAALLHLWLAYDHPFVDGNGRTARALFYWSMIRSGYWMTEFLSISHLIRKAPARYARSFLYTESDGNDATYFVLDQVEVLKRAIAALHEYIAQAVRELHRTQDLLKQSRRFNHRQLALLGRALGDRHAESTVASHANSHNITRQTARSDLNALVEAGLLVATKAGRGFFYRPAGGLEEKLKRSGRSRQRPRGAARRGDSAP